MGDRNHGEPKGRGLLLGVVLVMAACSSSSLAELGNLDGAYGPEAHAEWLSDAGTMDAGTMDAGTMDAGTMDLPSEPKNCLSFPTVTGGPFCAGRTWAGAGRYRCLKNCEPTRTTVPGIMTGMFPCVVAYADDVGSRERDVVCIPTGTCDVYCPDAIGSHD